MAENDEIVGGVQLFDKLTKSCRLRTNGIYTTRPFKVSILRELRKKTRELESWWTGLNQNLWEISRSSKFHQFLSTFYPGLHKLAKPLTLILKTTTTQLVENMPLSTNKAEDAEVGNGTSFTTRLAKNLSALMNMAEGTEVGEGDGSDDETVEKITFQ